MDSWLNVSWQDARHTKVLNSTVNVSRVAAPVAPVPQPVPAVGPADSISYDTASRRVDQAVNAIKGITSRRGKYSSVSGIEMDQRFLRILDVYSLEIERVKNRTHGTDPRIRVIERFRQECRNHIDRGASPRDEQLGGLSTKVMDKNGDEEEAGLEASVDETLSPAVMSGIRDVDRWLLRHMHDTGLMPSVWGENDKFSFVSRLLGLSARERLYMYFLIEKKNRHNAQTADVVESQLAYVPNVKLIKSQMKMSGLRIFRRAAMGRIYWDKLSDAYGMLEGARDNIKKYAKIDQNTVADKKSGRTTAGPAVRDEAAERARDKKLADFKDALIEYKNKRMAAESARIGKTRKRQAAAAAADKANRILRNLVDDTGVSVVKAAQEPDGQVAENKQDMADTFDRVGANAGDAFSAVNDPIMEGAEDALNSNSNFMGLSRSRLEKLKLVNISALSLVSITNVISACTGIAILNSQRSAMMAGDFTAATGELTAQIAGTLESCFVTTVNTLQYTGVIGESAAEVAKAAEQAAENLENVIEDSMTGIEKAAGIVGVATASLALTANVVSAVNNKSNSNYLNKSEKALNQNRANGVEVADETAEEKKRRENYEDNLLKLQKRNLSGQKKTIYTSIASNSMLLGASIIAGPVSALLAGASVVTNIYATIRDSITARRHRRKSVDDYLGIAGYDGEILTGAFNDYLANAKYGTGKAIDHYNGLNEKEKARFRKNYMDTLRESLRNDIMAKLGCAGKTAFYNLIMDKYGEILYNGAFMKSDGTLITEAELDREEGRPYVEFIHSLGLTIKFKDGKFLPSKETISARLQG